MAKKSTQKRSRRISSITLPQSLNNTTTTENNMSPVASSQTTYGPGLNGTAVRRIRTPHEHDVLSGRGGGINAHVGNVQFREWVRVRKNDYNLATNKADKARVAQEVIDLVLGQDPPGRFLQKDPTNPTISGLWVELEEDRVMAKTSQALREGAPSIRAAHRSEVSGTGASDHPQTHSNRARRKAAVKAASVVAQALETGAETETPTSTTPVPTRYTSRPATVSGNKRLHPSLSAPNGGAGLGLVDQEWAMSELRANVEEAKKRNDALEADLALPAAKRVRVEYEGRVVRPNDATPPLNPEVRSERFLPPPLDLSAIQRPTGNMKRTHSLALSDMTHMEEWANDDFVNPFEDEMKRLAADSSPASSTNENGPFPPPPRPGIFRETSSASNGDMGGIGALLKESETKSSSSSNGVRPRTSMKNSSSRSLTSMLSDLPDSFNPQPLETDFAQGVKVIYDATHPDVEEETIPTHLFPYRGGAFRNLRFNSNGNRVVRSMEDGRQ